MSATRVVCIKDTGQRVEFHTYNDAREAEVIATRLRELGCNAAVEPCGPRGSGIAFEVDGQRKYARGTR